MSVLPCIPPVFTVAASDNLQTLYDNFKSAENKFAIVLDGDKNQVGFTTKSIVLKNLLQLKKNKK